MKEIVKKIIQRSKYKSDQNKTKQFFTGLYNEFKEYTMISKELYIENLRVAQHISSIEGDIVECGVWRGGMSAGIAKLLGNERRTYYLFDSFEGLPAAKEIDGATAIAWQKKTEAAEYYDNCKAEIIFAEQAMQKAGCSFKLIKGWFSETLPAFEHNKPIALLRLDGDWYDSTMDCLKYLYPHVINNGIVIIDDYFSWDGCSKAVHDYLSSIRSSSKIFTSPHGVCYILKKEENQ